MVSQVLIEDIQQKSRRLTIDESTKSHYSTESIGENKLKELVETPVNQGGGKTDSNRSRGIVDQVISTLTAKRLVTKSSVVDP